MSKDVTQDILIQALERERDELRLVLDSARALQEETSAALKRSRLEVERLTEERDRLLVIEKASRDFILSNAHEPGCYDDNPCTLCETREFRLVKALGLIDAASSQ